MTTSSGRLKGDKLWHVYRYPQRPNTLMVLGSILTKPDDLESSLNYGDGIEPFPSRSVEDQTGAVRLFMRSEISTKNGGRLKALLPFSPIASAGGGLGATSSTSLDASIEASGVRAVAVLPPAAHDYLERALQNPRIVDYVRKGIFAEPLYMIVGVATCKSLSMGDASSKSRSASIDLDASLTIGGVEAGVGVSRDKGTSEDSEREVLEECDFAYRVREFQYSRRKKRIKKSANVTDGAMFGTDASGEEGPFEEVPIFEYFESEDEDVE
ncbi:hypothetical protein J7T55_007609 [Diaporthe amygdali]|uniref:uncharacterized protein n=1 Tax=Phomopsis amygdali TaxID=1214568 RepID=UPI0022FE4C17|nr:uncharacterized protein J7T55_007609 [Diaporthe amygdali]KAJ0107239.1 hypothetical protein J7T55_007609 [Diaporthe amygdali]